MDRSLGVFEQMSSFELMELMLAYNSTLLEQSTVFMSALFGYLAAAYFVGKKLNTFQLVSITVIYSVFSLNLLVGFFVISATAVDLLFFISGNDQTVVFTGYGVSLVAAFLLSIVFMFHARKHE